LTLKSVLSREKRHRRVRKNVAGTAERPRLSVYRSLNHVYAQIIDDALGSTLVAASTLDREFASLKRNRGSKAMAKSIGALLAKRAAEKGVSKVVFDRGGYKYHGVIKELAEAAREGGLEF
jgi:large subunit ribosomal protein L18